MSPSGLINFSDARSLSPSNMNAIRDIREMIKDAFDDDEFFQSLGKHLQEPGSAGNRQMDQALVAEALFNKVEALRSYSNLNHKALWGHVTWVLASYGYVMKAGRIEGHRLEYTTNEPATEVS